MIFADSRQLPEDSLSQSAHGGRGIRFHRVVTAFGEQRRLINGWTTLLSYDYWAKKVIASIGNKETALA